MSIRNWRSLGLALAAMAFAAWLPGAGVEAQTESKPAKSATTKGKVAHKVAIQVSQNDKAQMDLALNNAKNIIEFYKAKSVEAQTESKPAKSATAKSKVAHKVAIQVSQNRQGANGSGAQQRQEHHRILQRQGEPVAIEIVTYGPGLHMLRADTSPVKDRIAPMALENRNLKFIACANTQANQSKAEGKQVTLISEATVMPSGVVRLMELQNQGYAYIRP